MPPTLHKVVPIRTLLLLLSFLFQTTPSLLHPITLNPNHPIRRFLLQSTPSLSTFLTSTFLETPHLPPSSSPLVQTLRMPSLALSQQLRNWPLSSARLFLRYAMPP